MSTCPCELIEPCRSSCSCASPFMSGGCSRCASYGSRGQQLGHAKFIADAVAKASAAPEALEKRRSDFIEAILNLALKRQMGYAERRHGDVLNKECMDEVVQLCKGMAKAAIETTLSPQLRLCGCPGACQGYATLSKGVVCSMHVPESIARPKMEKS